MGNVKHVFISYIRENQVPVDRIAETLRTAGIQVWLDKHSIAPGARWRNAIRRAIEDGAFFLVCFSEEYARRGKSYMNEELTVAIGELRQYPAEQRWFMPVRLDACAVPIRDIGGGETLRDIQWIDMFPDWDAGMYAILKAVAPAKRTPPISGNTLFFDSSIDFEERIQRLVAAWIASGRGHDWLLSGKAFYGAYDWWNYAIKKTRDPVVLRDTSDYFAAGVSYNGDWISFMRTNSQLICCSCRQAKSTDGSRFHPGCMDFVCFECYPNFRW